MQRGSPIINNGELRCQLQGEIILQISNSQVPSEAPNIYPPGEMVASRMEDGLPTDENINPNEGQTSGETEGDSPPPPGHQQEIGPEEPRTDAEQPPLQDEETIERRRKLYRAAVHGDWEAALAIYSRHPDEVNATIGARGETALHIASLAGNTGFVREVLRQMNPDGLGARDRDDNTGLCLAAIIGRRELAEAIVDRGIEHEHVARALYKAAFSGHRGMVEYLYDMYRGNLNDMDRRDLLVALINADMFDVALKLINDREQLGLENEIWERTVLEKDKYEETALLAMARKPRMLINSRTWISRCWKDAKNREACELLERLWRKMVLLRERTSATEVFGNGWQPLFVAVENGNVEFLRILIKSYPEIVTKVNRERRTIFHVAVMHRQAEIFKMIHEIGSFKKMVATCIDTKGNNMLHLAAGLAPSHRLEIKPGAALQLQLELLWFEEVKRVVGPRLAQARNFEKDPKTPVEIFNETHRDLIKKGEELMRNTANSCILVAILVSTVVFAAAYTVPGGHDQKTGLPLFKHRSWFKVFAVADAISLISSTTSVLTFLSLLTSTYSVRGFARQLPTKLLIGLFALFVAIAAMMIAFVAAFFLYLKRPVALAAVGFIPIALFFWFHLRIFLSIVMSTYKCNSPFQPDGRDPLLKPKSC